MHSRSLNAQEQKELSEAIVEYQGALDFDASASTIEQIQERIHRAVRNAQASPKRDQKWLLDQAFLLGIAWGETWVRDLGWRWETLVADTKEEMLAVVSPDRALAVPVLLFLKRLGTTPTADPTTWLTFNMIKAGKFQAAAGALKLVG